MERHLSPARAPLADQHPRRRPGTSQPDTGSGTGKGREEHPPRAEAQPQPSGPGHRGGGQWAKEGPASPWPRALPSPAGEPRLRSAAARPGPWQGRGAAPCSSPCRTGVPRWCSAERRGPRRSDRRTLLARKFLAPNARLARPP